VLEIGAGSGYAAAVMSRLAAEVIGIERHAGLADAARDRLARLGYTNVEIHHADGTLGWPERAFFDAIVAAAAGPAVPQCLRRQLAVGGRLVMPVGPKAGAQRLVRVVRTADDRWDEEELEPVRFVPLVGREGWDGEV
jgi:protein-L-isoaspartate(D-aspartate) O-methyltransferase